jgi:acetyltransferase-like isoleucine patch superfamily enzyme
MKNNKTFVNKMLIFIKNIRDHVTIIDKGVSNSINFKKCVNKNNKISIYGDNNYIDINKSVINSSIIKIKGNNNKVIIENDINLAGCSVQISGNNHILHINKYCRFRNSSFWLEDLQNKITIGESTTCEGAHIAATETMGEIRIGQDCMFSFGIDIRNGDSHVIIDKLTGNRINYPKNVIIGDHVWIGAHVQILKNTNIGSGSVIGIRSLVSKNIPENCIAAGNPAKVLKNEVRWERDRTSWQKSSH